MRPLNLIPPEERRGDSAPLRAGAVSYAIVGVLGVALVAVVAVVLTGNQINDDKSKLATLEARQAAAQQASQSLAPYDDFASLAADRNATVSSLAKSRFDWERVLRELALVIPSEVTLESLSGSATAQGAANAAASISGADIAGPSLQISGCAEGQEGVARLLAALKDIDGVTRVGMQSSALSDTEGASGAAGGAGGCDTDSSAANFQITVAFDAVPAPASASTDSSGLAAGTATTTSEATTTAEPTSTDGSGDAAQAQAEQQAATDSASEQTRKASNSADAVGVGK